MHPSGRTVTENSTRAVPAILQMGYQEVSHILGSTQYGRRRRRLIHLIRNGGEAVTLPLVCSRQSFRRIRRRNGGPDHSEWLPDVPPLVLLIGHSRNILHQETCQSHSVGGVAG